MSRFLSQFILSLSLTGLLSVQLSTKAAEISYEGNWKVSVVLTQAKLNVWLIEVKVKGGMAEAKLLSVGMPQFAMTKISEVKVSDKGISVKMNARGNDFTLTAAPAKGDEKGNTLFGSIAVRGSADFIEMEKTDLTKLDPAKGNTPFKAFGELRTAISKEELKDQVEALTAITAQKDLPGPLAMQAGISLVNRLARDAKNKEEIRKQSSRLLASVSRYGETFKMRAYASLAQGLIGEKAFVSLAVNYLQEARKLMSKDSPIELKGELLGLLANALKKSGKTDEAKTIEAEVAKIEQKLDEEFEKTNIPFKPEKYAGRKAKSDRVVVVELFTGSECPPCVAADVAFDAMLKTYDPSQVVLLQYHNHIPRPDPLTNPAVEKRHSFYKGMELYTPLILINGNVVRGGGGRSSSEQVYKSLRANIDKVLETKAKADLKLSSSKQGESIEVKVAVSNVENPSEKMKLRFVLIEDAVHFAGGNGQRIHHHVVRDLPGGANGFTLKEKSLTKTVVINPEEVKKGLAKYLNDFGGGVFQGKKQPMELKDLKVVALIQNDETKEVVTAAQIDLP